MRVEVSKYATSKAAMDLSADRRPIAWRLFVTAEEVADFLDNPDCHSGDLSNSLLAMGGEYEVAGGARKLRECGLVEAAEEADRLLREDKQRHGIRE